MLLALSPNASTDSSAWPGSSSRSAASATRQRCRSSLATRKSTRAERTRRRPAGRTERGGGGYGWPVDEAFIVNLSDAPARSHSRRATIIDFEPDDAPWPDTGVNVQIMRPGQPNARYHSEPVQEDFLVLHGEMHRDRRRRGAAAAPVGFPALSGGGRAHLRGRRHGTVRRADDRIAAQAAGALPGQRAGREVRRVRRERHR